MGGLVCTKEKSKDYMHGCKERRRCIFRERGQKTRRHEERQTWTYVYKEKDGHWKHVFLCICQVFDKKRQVMNNESMMSR